MVLGCGDSNSELSQGLNGEGARPDTDPSPNPGQEGDFLSRPDDGSMGLVFIYPLGMVDFCSAHFGTSTSPWLDPLGLESGWMVLLERSLGTSGSSGVRRLLFFFWKIYTKSIVTVDMYYITLEVQPP